MRLRTRVFLLSFLPFALLLGCSFLAIQLLVQSTVRHGLESKMREDQESIARLRARAEIESERSLRIVGENASLKAGIQLLLLDRNNPVARATAEDQLAELCGTMGFDLLTVSDSAGNPIVGVIRQGTAPQNQRIVPLEALPKAQAQGLITINQVLYRVGTVSVDQGDDNLGQISVGTVFDLTQFNTPAVLLKEGRVILTNLLSGVSIESINQALKDCLGVGECAVSLHGSSYISLPLDLEVSRDGFQLRSLQNVDATVAPLRSVLHRIFLIAGVAAFGFALLFSAFGSRAIAEPIIKITSHLKKSGITGQIAEFEQTESPIQEVTEMIASFNRSAKAIRQAQNNLQSAYVEFVGSLANALDARDPYTAGHSHRVSSLSCSIAAELGVSDGKLDEIRLGALLHDIGKIGVSDSVLRKPGRLSDEEFALIKQHPEIGRRILEGVQGFSPYLDAVELHHENWDGSGYPRAQAGEETPLAARIIHVADAYDAMTSDRPYRLGMGHEKAMKILVSEAGRQFDPTIVRALEHLCYRGDFAFKRRPDWQKHAERETAGKQAA